MNAHYTYLLLDAFTFFFPFVLSFDKKVAFYKQWRYLFPPMIITAAFFIVWDVLFTQWGMWSFNPEYLTGIYLANLPIEEWLFFIVVPYACTFIYACLLAYLPIRSKLDKGWRFILPLGVFLLIAGVIYWQQAYTFTALAFCGIALILLFVNRRQFASFRADGFLYMFLISIVPFFIVNGFLTAMPVVQYNDSENLGIRLYTIPVEDTFYGMLLMLGNVAGMEWLRSRSAKIR